MDEPTDLLEITIDPRSDADVSVLCVAGEVDLYTLPILVLALAAWVPRVSTSLVLDMSEVPFLCAGGVGLLARAAVSAAERGVLMRVMASARVLRTISLVGLAGLLVHPCRETSGPLRAA